MLNTHAVGIDLGTTYSCIAYLNEHGEPVTLANQEGELSTPSVVLFDQNEVIVGTEALRNAILHPNRVVQNSKRFMGDSTYRWKIDGKPYTPIDVATFILKKLLSAAQEQIGPIEQAVITVPAQFSDFQRHATIEAGHRAGLQKVDVINEPVAAALCYVLGTEGLWFSQLANEQRIMVYDLGGGTFDLSLVKYQKNEVSVIASAGDLDLGGIDWNNALEQAIAKQFRKEFGVDPRQDPESLQFLALETEQAKRSLTVRPRAALTCQHAGHRKTYQVEQAQFEKLTKPLVDHTAKITKKMLKDKGMGWAHVDAVLLTGGSSRMPMIKAVMKKMSGTTPNKTLSPDQSIAHGATYYAGMLITNDKFARSILNERATERLSNFKQKSVNARALGILIRDTNSSNRIPHYLIPANSTLPASQTQRYGTVVPNQRRVNLQIVESGTTENKAPVKLGECIINDLPPNLPEGSEVEVTIRYDAQARVHVDATDVSSGKKASVEVIRQENMVAQLAADHVSEQSESLKQLTEAAPSVRSKTGNPTAGKTRASQSSSSKSTKSKSSGPKLRAAPVPPQLQKPTNGLEESDEPVPLDEHGRPLDVTKLSQTYDVSSKGGQQKKKSKIVQYDDQTRDMARKSKSGSSVPAPPNDDEIVELDQKNQKRRPPT
ncbi:MAG: Hsp70 family protein, partial [Planctomycetaceae bacterium]|nr:Hsp70 family protein [Planctomycetaceae bacterium]